VLHSNHNFSRFHRRSADLRLPMRAISRSGTGSKDRSESAALKPAHEKGRSDWRCGLNIIRNNRAPVR
jgi:hypothetical protein